MGFLVLDFPVWKVSIKMPLDLYPTCLLEVLNFAVVAARVLKGQESNKLPRLPAHLTHHWWESSCAAQDREAKRGSLLHQASRQDGRQRQHAFLASAFHMCCREVTISILHIKHLLLTLLLPLLLPHIHPQAKQRRHQNACHKYSSGKQTLK